MLSIERRTGESLFIGDDVGIEVLEIGRHYVSLAVRAPGALTILRHDIARRRPACPAADGIGRRMLILRRRAGESLSIGADIEVIVGRIRSAHTTLLVRAMPSTRVRRSDSRIVAGEKFLKKT